MMTTYYFSLALGSFLIIYLYCMWQSWKRVRRAYDPGGMWEHVEFFQFEGIFIFIPIINIVWLIILIRNENWWKQQKKSGE